MKLLLPLLGGLVLFGCTPTVKEVALYRGKGQIEIVKKGSFFFSEEEKGFISREARRLGIDVPENEDIKRHLRRLLKNPRSLELALRRANLYIPYIKPILLKKGLPEELSLLPLIESGFNPFAVSRSGAAGIWQLMPDTARRYGLRVDGEVDERFDLLKSTEAAASYLKDLHRRFGSWELVLAAYNCGEGCVSRRTEGVNFWRSKWALPDQTREYVPSFFASLLIARAPHRYGLRVTMSGLNIRKVVSDRRERVSDLVAKLGIRHSTFRDLNPHIKGNYVPAGTSLYLPEKVTLRKVVKKSPPKEPKPEKDVNKKRSVKVVKKTSPKVVKKPAQKLRVKKVAKLSGGKVVKLPEKKPKRVVKKPKRVVKVNIGKGVSKSLMGALKKTRTKMVKKPHRELRDTRIVIKRMDEEVKVRTKVITLENGALLYIKE